MSRPMSHGPAGNPEAAAALHRALEISEELLRLAEAGGDVERVIGLDAERLRLIKSARHALTPMNEKDRAVLRQIADLNARSIGHMEHRFRARCRDMDMLAAGRRALRAYSNQRP